MSSKFLSLELFKLNSTKSIRKPVNKPVLKNKHFFGTFRYGSNIITQYNTNKLNSQNNKPIDNKPVFLNFGLGRFYI